MKGRCCALCVLALCGLSLSGLGLSGLGLNGPWLCGNAWQTSSAWAAAKSGAGKNPTASAAPAASKTQVEDAAAAYTSGDYVKARQLWQELAAKGDARAMNNLGVLFDRGQGVPEDPAEAVRWFKQAAESGHGPGMSNYGRMLEQGRGVTRDAAQAAHWFQQAAERNVADAQYNLGVLYERGEGVPASDKDAAAWYSRAAANQQVNAQARLGQFYRDGRGVDKNATRAVLLLYGAAMEGHSSAVHDLEVLAEQERAAQGAGKSGGRAGSAPASKASVFGVELAGATRATMRDALKKSAVPAVREDDQYICDVYNVRKSVPGATELAACYGTAVSGDVSAQPLGFIKIDYPATDRKHAGRVRAMVEGRFGKASAGEGADGALWNLGTVIVATQFVPDTKQVGLMYMIPRVYHLTRQGAAVSGQK